MRKLIAMFAVFGSAALIAVYVAHAPLANSAPAALRGLLAVLDGGAAWLSGIAGRNTAVLSLLGIGMALGMLVGLFSGDKSGPDETELQPGPVWRPEPLAAQDDRIARLRRRADAEVSEPVTGHPAFATVKPAEPAPAERDTLALAPAPIVLARKVRADTGDWTEAASWLGGLPRLAGAEWPRDAEGRALPFAAQIDLAQLAQACPQSPLAREGSLAFFLAAGAVIAVPPGSHEFTDPPADLPPAYEEGGAPLPGTATRLSRFLFPFWPIEPMAVPVAEDVRDHGCDAGHEAIEMAVSDMVRTRFGEPSTALEDGNDDMLWWYGVFHLADQLREALDGADGSADANDQREPMAEQEAAAIRAIVQAMDGFVANRDPWEPLTSEERDLVVDILDEIHRHHGRFLQHSLPRSLASLQALCIRAMASGAPEAFAALPGNIRARIASRHRIPAGFQHMLLAPGGGDPILLQLARDDMMEWRWEGGGLFRFRISAQDATTGNWDRARLTFETEPAGKLPF